MLPTNQGRVSETDPGRHLRRQVLHVHLVYLNASRLCYFLVRLLVAMSLAYDPPLASSLSEFGDEEDEFFGRFLIHEPSGMIA